VDDHIYHRFTLVARCGHEIDRDTEAGTERALYLVPCAAMLVLELLRELDVSETEVRKWVVE
jgi:hypothetical protein